MGHSPLNIPELFSDVLSTCILATIEFLFSPQPEFPSRRFYQNTLYTYLYITIIYTALSCVYTQNHKNNITTHFCMYSVQASHPDTG